MTETVYEVTEEQAEFMQSELNIAQHDLREARKRLVTAAELFKVLAETQDPGGKLVATVGYNLCAGTKEE